MSNKGVKTRSWSWSCFESGQGDQMRLWKFRPKCSQAYFCQNLYVFCTKETRSTKVWATFVIFKKLPKVNNRPLGEKLHNLFALNLGTSWALWILKRFDSRLLCRGSTGKPQWLKTRQSVITFLSGCGYTPPFPGLYVGRQKGGQMSWWKTRPKWAQNVFWQK
jgi:hypothetical protein